MAFCKAGEFVKSCTECSEHVSEKSPVDAENMKAFQNTEGEG